MGNVIKVTTSTPAVYRGKEIQMIEKDGKFSYHVSQKKFLDNLAEGKLKIGRLQKDATLTTEEWKEMRSVCGSLQWVGGQTRPDVASTASLCHRGSETDINDLKRLYETLEYAKITADSGLVFPAVPFNRASTIVTFADSGWANAAKFSSQFGVVVTLCPAQVTEKPSHGFILDWKSGRSGRICRSTLAAEAVAADEGTDRSTFINLVITELLYQKPASSGDMRMNAAHVTDAKSLYDCLVAENPVLSEKRAIMNVRSVQQFLLPSQIRWVPTQLMVADCLTKCDRKLQNVMRMWCQAPLVQLKESKSDSTS